MGFQQGLSGLNATAKSLEVIGNNIANSSTYGAKSARAEFADVYAAALNGAGASAIGIGVNLSAVSQQFTQGNIIDHRQPDGPGDQRRRVLPGDRRQQPGQLHAQRPVQGRPRRLHRQQQPAEAARLPGQRHRHHPARQRGAAAAADLGHRPADHGQRHARDEPRLAPGRHARRRAGAADQLRRPGDLQQRDLDDGVRRQGPGRRADLLLPEVRHRHLERVRHRQRQHGRRHGRGADAGDDDHLPGQWLGADVARRRRWRSNIPASTNAAGAADAGDSRRAARPEPARRSSAPTSASPT